MRTRSRSRHKIAEPLRIEFHSQEDQFQEDPPGVSMADNRTMAQLLQAPTVGYEDAIVIPKIAATNFELKHGNPIRRSCAGIGYVVVVNLAGNPHIVDLGSNPCNWDHNLTPWVQEIATSFKRLKVYCTDLRILSLENSSISEKDGEWLHELALHNSSIESLNFYKAGFTKFDVKDLALVAKNCSQSLVSVKISEHYDFIDLVEFFSYAVNLEDFGGGRFGDNNALDVRAQRAKYKDFKLPPNLKSHHHHHHRQHSLIENCPNLEVLYTPSISNEGMEHLSQYCKTLRKLYVMDRRGVLTDKGINLKNLSDLSMVLGTKDVSVKDSVIDNGIRTLLIGCNKLERLSICFQKLGGLSDIDNDCDEAYPEPESTLEKGFPCDRLDCVGGQKSKEDEVQPISTSVFVTNFPDMFGAKDLWNSCKSYGHVADAYIPDRRSKVGKRFGFVRFIKVPDVDRLVSKLCTMWVGRYKLHANVVRFQRAPVNKYNDKINVNGSSSFKVGSMTSGDGVKGTNNSYAYVVKGDKVLKDVEDDTPMMVLDEACLNTDDYSLSFFGKVKQFASLTNLKVVLAKEGYTNIDLKYMGGFWVMIGFQDVETKNRFHTKLATGSWFSQIIQAHNGFPKIF
nr:nucleotide-binding alpha-beta plait domain-containing protein [Tanacetum cinerariifolium]